MTSSKLLAASLVLLAACGVDADPAELLPADQAPVPELVLSHNGIDPGTTTTFRIDGASYGETVYLTYSLRARVEGAGICASIIGNQCLDLLAPVQVLRTGMVDATGRADILVDVPDRIADGDSLSVQAVVVRGLGGADSLISNSETLVATPRNTDVGWVFSGLTDLGPDYVYENWLITDDGPVSVGRFSVNASGLPSSSLAAVTPELVGFAQAFVVTIEPVVGDDPGPSAVHILAGDLVDGIADLFVQHPAALGTDFSDASGAYFLQTPTSADPDDYFQGIWFFDPVAGMASLSLPALPAGWEYEGWTVVNGMPLSTGRFLDPTMADLDGAGAASGPMGSPAFPGQDFINPAYDLSAATVVISVEPSPDNSPAPFLLKPLVDEVEDLGPGVLETMSNQAASTNPTGIAWFE